MRERHTNSWRELGYDVPLDLLVREAVLLDWQHRSSVDAKVCASQTERVFGMSLDDVCSESSSRRSSIRALMLEWQRAVS